MGAVTGAISIKSNMSAVLRGIRQEQSAFRADVGKTKKELQAAWDKKRTAKLDATAASKTMDSMKKKLEPLRKKIVTAVAIKDMATAKVKTVTNKVKAVGKMVATPVVNVAVKGAKALSAIGHGVTKAAKIAAVGIGAVAAAGAAGLTALFSGSTEAAKAQIEAETKLEAVLGNVKSIQAQGADAAAKAKSNLMGVASSLQQVGVIGDEVTLAGMQQLATFQLSDKEISTLAGGMTDLLAQQKGLNATQEDSVTISNMIGKAMNGQLGALSRVGISFTEAQSAAMEVADSEGRAAILAEILQQNVGGVNKALANTDQGKIQQMSNAFGDMKEEVGKVALTMKSKLAGVVMKNIPLLQSLGTTLMTSVSTLADKAMPVLDGIITNVAPMVEEAIGRIGRVVDVIAPVLGDLFGGLSETAATVKPVLNRVVSGFGPLLPPLAAFGKTVMQTLQSVTTAVMPAIGSIIGTVQSVIPAVLPVLTTVITTIGGVISQAAPIIAGLVEGIGGVITTLAPIFQTIFDGIGEKVGSVVAFIGSKMGFIQSVFETVGPAIGAVLTTAWSVISPIMDLAISVFEVIFSVVERVFPGIQKIIETVWNFIKPLVEGIGSVIGGIAGALGGVSDMITGGGGKVGANAQGTNNWRGGPTWVGEEGPELLDLPKGSRVLPNKESVQVAQSAAQPVVREIFQNTVERPVVREVIRETAAQPAISSAARDTAEKPAVREMVRNTVEKSTVRETVQNTVEKSTVRESIKEAAVQPATREVVKGAVNPPADALVSGNAAASILALIDQRVNDIYTLFTHRHTGRPPNPQDTPMGILPRRIPDTLPPPMSSTARDAAPTISVTLAKLANTIIVREDADVDKIGEALAKKVVLAVRNLVPV